MILRMLPSRLPLLLLLKTSSPISRPLSTRAQYAAHFKTLNLPVTASRSQVRVRYLELVKLHHPDTRNFTKKTGLAEAEFESIDLAYRGLQGKFKEDEEREKANEGEYGLYYDKFKTNTEETEVEEPTYPSGIEHVIPQHRQYLDNGGIGFGTPSQRQKQSQKYRAFKANEAVFERRFSKLTAEHEDRLVTVERQTVKKQQTRNQIERLVEDLIQESISRGEFDNLSGAGQPLPTRPPDYNPYLDFTTHKMNQILVETGFSPEWVELQKEIRNQTGAMRGELRKCRQTLGASPLNMKEALVWQRKVETMRATEEDINQMITKFNLIVPIMNNQKFRVCLQKESDKIFQEGFDPSIEAGNQTELETANSGTSVTQQEEGIFSSFLKSIFNKS